MDNTEIKRSPILITGCSRSGAGLIAGVINLCGAFGGHQLAKGIFENGLLREGVEKPYLKSIGCDPNGQKVLPDTSSMSIPSDWKRRVSSTMIQDGYKDGPWFYKSSKSCLIWPVWHYAYPNAKWVIVRRRSADIAKSCMHTSFMNAYSTHEEWIKWINFHEDRFVEMIQAGLNVKIIWPERLVKGNYEQLYEVIEWLGLPWQSQEVLNFIDPKLWKAKLNEKMKV
jgi:hypothetical protein